jgi:hypothetical protein
LVIFGVLVFAAMIDGGSWMLGRFLPIARIWRVMLVLFGAALFFYCWPILQGRRLHGRQQNCRP